MDGKTLLSSCLRRMPAIHPGQRGRMVSLVAYNGGNFYLSIPDENENEEACRMFGLSNKLFKGWVPDIEYLMGKLVPRGSIELRENVTKG